MFVKLKTGIEKIRESQGYKLAKWLFIALLLIIAIQTFKADEIQAKISQIPLNAILLAMLLFFVARVFYAFRWHLLLYGLGINNFSFLYILRVLLFASFMSIVLPSYLGSDGVRWWKLGKYTDKSTALASSLLLDRLIGSSSLFLLAILFASQLQSVLTESFSLIDASYALIFGAGILLIAIALLVPQIRHYLKKLWNQFTIAPRYILLGFISSFLGHWVFATGYYVLYQALLPVDFLPTMAIVMLALATRAVPITVLGLEASDASLLALAGLTSISNDVSLSVLIIVISSRYFLGIVGLISEVVFDGWKFLEQRQTPKAS